MAETMLVNQRQFKFEMVAPEKVEVSSFEERVLLPGEEGDFMVLAGHTQLLAGLRPGVVSVHHSHNNIVRYFITGGFADVGNQHCTVLTPHITPVSKLIADRIARDIDRLEAELETAETVVEKDRIRSELEILRIQLDVAEKYND